MAKQQWYVERCSQCNGRGWYNVINRKGYTVTMLCANCHGRGTIRVKY